MVVAVHSPVFRSLLRSGSEAGGSRESREGVIDMCGPQHPPGRVVRCLLKMMYASPGLAIDELGHEPKLSDGTHAVCVVSRVSCHCLCVCGCV